MSNNLREEILEKMRDASIERCEEAVNLIYSDIGDALTSFVQDSFFSNLVVNVYSDFDDFCSAELCYSECNTAVRFAGRNILCTYNVNEEPQTRTVNEVVSLKRHTSSGENLINIIMYGVTDTSEKEYIKAVLAVYVPVGIFEKSKAKNKFLKCVE